jgi:hypothetical protein
MPFFYPAAQLAQEVIIHYYLNQVEGYNVTMPDGSESTVSHALCVKCDKVYQLSDAIPVYQSPINDTNCSEIKQQCEAQCTLLTKKKIDPFTRV